MNGSPAIRVTLILLGSSLLAGAGSGADAPRPSSDLDSKAIPASYYLACIGKDQGEMVLVTKGDGDEMPAACVRSPAGLVALPAEDWARRNVFVGPDGVEPTTPQ